MGKRLEITSQMKSTYSYVDFNNTRIEIRQYGRKSYRYMCYCPDCGAQRGYNKRDRWNKKCISCAQKLKITDKLRTQYQHVDFEDFIKKFTGQRYVLLYNTICDTCQCNRGYLSRVDWERSKCIYCANIDINKRIKHSCTHRNISPDEFIDFKTNIVKLEREEFVRSGLSKTCFNDANYVCDMCNKKNNLNAHHLNCWSDYPAQRFDINNLICLCVQCHKKFHTQYRWKHNIKAQYLEFKAN